MVFLSGPIIAEIGHSSYGLSFGPEGLILALALILTLILALVL